MNNQEIEVLNTAKEYIERLIAGINEAVQYIQCGNEKLGIEMIPLIGEGIEYITDILLLLPLEVNSNDIVVNLNSQLEEVVQGLENEDYVLVADILAYEVVTIIKDIQGILVKF
ncbi:hypothetical protein [Clostridium sp.]|uniref:hypothetical protein n=1 Tax=Clostridium sp. TaxID=1506 RepID=UPI003217E5EE